MMYTKSPPPAKADVFEEIVEQASKMKDKYKNNPYVSVTGFSVNVGVPPSMSINIEFKK